MFVDIHDLGEFAFGCEWMGDTTPESVQEDVDVLIQGQHIVPDCIFYPENSGEIELKFASVETLETLETMAEVNPIKEKFYRVKSGVFCATLTLTEFVCESAGNLFWDDPNSGEVFSKRGKGVLTLSLL